MDKDPRVSARHAGNDTAGATQKATRQAKPEAGARLTVAKTYKIYIGGKFPRTESGRYYPLRDKSGEVIANICSGSRKDFREAVVAARGGFANWSSTNAYLRGQILYRIAEMLEGRGQQFVAELVIQGVSKQRAATEVTATVDRLVYYAGWADKYQQVFSAVNPVASSHFNFSVLEPMGVISILAPEDSGLLGLVSNIAPAITGANTCVVLASTSMPLCAISFAEVLESSDVPPGVVNILTGSQDELAGQFASHMDVNAVIHAGSDGERIKEVQLLAANNIKRTIVRTQTSWVGETGQGPYFIKDTQETKTTWHPVGA
ncbi:MAG: aldehyde dehydrogenase family protein [Gammaproteobacteria bacterium]|nr:aldehyde dehydrogenase family protein [Gammaproteobacteria bacterium]